MRSLTASAEGGVWWNLLLIVPVGFLTRFATLLADDSYSALRAQVKRLGKSESGSLIITDGVASIRIDPEITDLALSELPESIPPITKGELRYVQEDRRWIDTGDQ